MRNWLLPEYIEDILPSDAARIEKMRRDVLELFRVHGYDFVIPPMLEHVESLFAGTGGDMDLRTFKLVDQLSGRTIGLRADITPQAARIDAHLLNRAGVTRLCYCGSVLHTLPLGLTRSREPMQIGAEIYGHGEIESDIEIQKLMLESLSATGLKGIQLDLGHVGVYRALARRAEMDKELELDIFKALQAKDSSSLNELTGGLDGEIRQALRLLPELYGREDVLARAGKHLPDFPEIREAIADLDKVSRALDGCALSFDLAELRGYHYHSAMVFAVYVDGCPNAIALGGRYDEVGKSYGRARPATGFSMDLREISDILPKLELEESILAPFSDDKALGEKIASLRRSGQRVLTDLPGRTADMKELRCNRKLEKINGSWEVVVLK